MQKCIFQCRLKAVETQHCITELVWQQIPGHRTGNREDQTTEVHAMMLWHHELMAAGITEMLMTGSDRCGCTEVDH